MQNAIQAVKKLDMVIVFAGSNRDYETKSSHRSSLKLPFEQEVLINKIKAVNPNAIAVLTAGVPFDIADLSQNRHSSL